MATPGSTEFALQMLRRLPRVSLSNLKDNPGSRQPDKDNRGSRAVTHHGWMGIDRHGHGHKKLKQHGCLPPLGFEGGRVPFYRHVPQEFYYKGFHLRRQYPPMSMLHLQRMIDQGLLDPTYPIDLTQLIRAGVQVDPTRNHYGVNLTDDGCDVFQARINLEVQWCSNEAVIAAVERAGGVITTAFFDSTSVHCAAAPQKWFKEGSPIPRRMLPPQNCIEYYMSPANRGYLAPPETVVAARLETAQKFGYELSPELADPNGPDPRSLLGLRKHPRQLFYGLEPGWLVDVVERRVLKPRDPQLQAYYGNA